MKRKAVRWARRGALGWLLAIQALGAQATCDPRLSCCLGDPFTGSPCGGAGVATQGNSSAIDLGIGNPLHLISGNKFQREVDLAPLPGVFGLELIRYHNSADRARGLLGRGWRLSYETELHARGAWLQIVQADGTRLVFRQTAERRGHFRTRRPLQGLVQTLNTPRGTEYRWTWADGRELRFNSAGKLDHIRAASGEFVSLRYDDRGWLQEVIDPAGRRLGLRYLDKAGAKDPQRYRGVHSIDTPAGRFQYGYGGAVPAGASAPPGEAIANLKRVSYPAPRTAEGGQSPIVGRLYHHEDPRHPSLLTGISALRRGSDGQTRHERLNTWAYDEQGRGVLSVQGEGSASEQRLSLRRLPALNGPRQTVLSNAQGQTTRYTISSVAGEPRLLQAVGPGCATCSPGSRRYAYDRQGQLRDETVLDEQGRPLRTTRTERDAYGRPTRVSDIAYHHGQAQPPRWRVRYDYPAPDDDGVPSTKPVLIAIPSVIPDRERLTRITYNAAQQPLTVIEEGFSPVDAQGRPTPQGSPIRRSTAYAYATLNGRSLLASVDGPLANGAANSPEDSDITRLEWDARGDFLRGLIRPGPRAISVQREPGTGRVVDITGPGGRQLSWPAEARVPAAVKALASTEQPIGPRVELDAWSRPVAWRDADGRDGDPLLSAGWGPPGSVAEASVLTFATPHAQAQRQLDDFARVVAIRHPGQGWRTAAYDEAGRIAVAIDPRGARQYARWDLADRLTRLARFAPGAADAEQVVEHRYVQDRLVESVIHDAHGSRSNRFTYDARGAVVSETLEIRAAGALRSAMPERVRLALASHKAANGEQTRTLIDAAGRSVVIAQALADGQVSAMHTQGVLPLWLGGGRAVVHHIEWQALGELRYATAITHGDGSVDRFEPVPLGLAERPHPGANASGAAFSPPLHPFTPPGQGHDAAGLPGSVRTSQGVQRLSWNAAGQLEQTERDDGSRSRYVYDARGRRVATLVLGPQGQARASLSLYDGHRLAAEADAQGRLTYAYAHLGQRPVAQIPLRHANAWQRLLAWLFGPRARHLHTARAGRVIGVSEAGRLVWQDGAATEGEPIHQPLRYVGQTHDEDSGLDYHGARFFDPAEGRFISPDPAGVADAVNDVPQALLLDLYAYAGGQPDGYFDPDGAAKLTYYLIDTEPQTHSTPSVTGRWAFWLRDIGGANALTQVLYDPRGSFLGSSSNPLRSSASPSATASYALWNASQANSAGTVQAFVSHYVNDMISPDSFTVPIEDVAALQLIEDLQNFGDVARKYYAATCSAGTAGGSVEHRLVLPPVALRGIKLAPGGIAGQNDAPGGERIAQGTDKLTCKQAMTPERAFQRLKKAVEIKESGGLDCSAKGCPSGVQNPSGSPASYGSTQFVVSTFVDRLLSFSQVRNSSANVNLAYRILFNSQVNLSEDEREQLGFADAQGQDSGLRARLTQASLRSLYVLGGRLGTQPIVGWKDRLSAPTPIAPPDDTKLSQFARETGFAHTLGSTSSEAYTMYVRMVKWWQMFELMEPYRSQGGGSPANVYHLLRQKAQAQQLAGVSPTDEEQFERLLTDMDMTRTGFGPYLRQRIWNEGWQGFATAAVFTDRALKATLLDNPDALFKSQQKFDLISDREIRWKYAEYRINHPHESEEDTVARVGYFHNAGSNAGSLTTARGFGYARGLMVEWNNLAKVPCIGIETPRLALDPAKPQPAAQETRQ